ncbi:DUF3298 and DUF4163 domain-containing protein [Bacillus multifaciens]|uniref:DUF3298 and DUF4163 domain-containing protein n=1 Tax=Bacillus multifaciens TaxID=3068506 RepID=UPI0027422B05|nr:DUF3298 and DUF4163 domain-containing protein [Bacillus sp. WLY-B-L8]MDP7979299.1 DUF3298 and DUF4163 domain-containing protein [Bacillus sp. WLY-B-L8]
MKKLLYIMLLFFFLIAIVPKETIRAQASNITIEVHTATQKGKKPYFEYQLNYPQFRNIPNEKFQKKVNRYYEKSITEFKRRLEKDAKTYYEQFKETDAPFHPYVANVDYKIGFNTFPLLSLYVNYYQYTGGAHGMYEWKANTFDIEQNKPLRLADLFQKDSQYENIIKTEIVRQIEQNKENFFPDASEKVMNEKKLKYVLEQDNLMIYFPLYEIAPYVSGIPQFRIPYTLLREVLDPKYQNILIDNA